MNQNIRVPRALAITILRTVGEKSDKLQSDEWLWLHWQTLKPWNRSELVQRYVTRTKVSA
jgi:hypothetical protein